MTAREDMWEPFRFFLGDWNGTSRGRAGDGTVERSYRLVLGDRFIEIEDRADYAPQDANPTGEVHEERGFLSYDEERQLYVLREFHVEGFALRYLLESDPAETERFVFVTEAAENMPPGWRARTTLEILSADGFQETFELAGPEKPWSHFVTIVFVRASNVGR